MSQCEHKLTNISTFSKDMPDLHTSVHEKRKDDAVRHFYIEKLEVYPSLPMAMHDMGSAWHHVQAAIVSHCPPCL